MRGVVVDEWVARGVEPLVGLAVRLRADTAHDGPTTTAESLSAALRMALVPEARVRATAGAIRTDGATVAATLLLDAVSRERPPVSA